MRLTDQQLGPRGELRQTESFGPATFGDWEVSFKVGRTGCLVLGAITISSLDLYHSLIKHFAQRYGGSVWMLLYQADVRSCMEHMERLRRQGAAKDPSFKANQP